MRASRLIVILLVLVAAGFSRPLQAQVPRAQTPTVKALTDRTAMWIGDRITYTIEIVCPRGVDVLDDDLAKEKLRLDGLEVVGGDTSRTDGAGELRTRRFNYVLTSYRPELTSRRIAPITVRYYVTRPGQRIEDTPPAGSLQVPATIVAFRSMLPEDQEASGVRDLRPFEHRARLYTLAQPVGLGLIILSIAPVLIWGTALLTRTRTRKSHRSARQVRREERASLEAVHAMSIESEEGRREAFDRLNSLVRGRLQDRTGVAGRSLTPEEIPAALAARGSRLDAAAVAAVLASCERARYGPPSALPTADECRGTLAQAEGLVNGK